MDITISGRDALYTCIEQARRAIVEFSGETVGKYLGASSEYSDLHALTHRFEAELPGYRGWHWEVVMAAAPGATVATVSEVVLVPGAEALRPPNWIPWEERIRPGDLGPGDLLAPPPNDPRLVPGYTDSGDPQVTETAGEIGLGRKQVLSLAGRIDAAQRWFDGDWGPDAEMARATRRVCRSCGFTCRWPARWVSRSECAPIRCPPTGAWCTSSTAAALIPIHRSRSTPRCRCMSPSTTAFSI
ncbi:Protein of uncharacterised function (DUF3027) [Mycobacteroides abscessus]|nr:Protein of uncharacterised function (DUF3027) [Mycobacteroides abscessus]